MESLIVCFCRRRKKCSSSIRDRNRASWRDLLEYRVDEPCCCGVGGVLGAVSPALLVTMEEGKSVGGVNLLVVF